ncbi:hypothetical protein G6F56_003536 [Rhizopus delemar]|nr:hypothetical protein G6F56_003536 [Rhizopus delemar]
MSSLNEALEFKETISQEEILFLKEKIKTLEGKNKRFELIEHRALEQDEELIHLRLELGKEREKTSQLLIKEEKARLIESQHLSSESYAKSEIYRLEKIKIDQLVERASRLKTQNDAVIHERDSAVDELTLTKDSLRRQKVELDLVKQELAQIKVHCGQMESECRANLNNFDICSEDYKNTLFEKSVTINNLEQLNTELKEHVKELEKKMDEQRELTEAQLINITGPDNNASSPLLRYIQDYKKLGKYPEQIYKEFFEIREKYTHLIEKHEQFSSLASRLESELSDKNSLFARLQKELETYKTQAQQSKKLASDRKTIAEQLSAELEEVEAEHVKLTSEKSRLEQALQDTSYQLQYLIFDVYKRQDPIPAPVKQIANHLTSSKILTSHLPHEDLVFKNIAGLQNLNRDLSEKVRGLQLEIKLNSTSVRSEIQSKTDKLADAKKQLAAIKEQLSESQKQKEMLEQELLTKPSPVQDDMSKAFTSLLAEFQQVSESFAQYRTSTTSDLALMQAELEKSGRSERESQSLVRSLQAEISMVQSQFSACQDTLQQKARELENTRHQIALTHSQCVDQKTKLDKIIQELNERETSLRALQLENVTLQAQYDAQTKLCEAIQQEKTESNAERVKLNNMLESINARIKESEVTLVEETQVYKAKSNELSGQLKFAQETIKTLEKELERAKYVQLPGIEAQYKESQEKVTVLKEKLAEYETREPETNIKKMNEFIPIQSSCEEHNQLISELNNKVAALEEANEEYVSHVEDVHKKFSNMAKEHYKYVEENEEYTRKLKEALDERNQSLLASQEIAEKAKEEYGTMCENLKNAQDKLTAENVSLKEEKRRLEEEQETQKKQMEQLDLTIEEQRLMHATMQEKAAEDARLYEKLQEEEAKNKEAVAQLENEVNDSKQKLQDALNELALDKKRYEGEATRWVQFQEDINKYREEAEKNNSVIRDSLDELIDVWKKAEGGDSHIPELTNEMMSLIRQHNAVASHKKEVSDARYLEEYKKCKALQQEVACLQVKLNMARDAISELEKASKNEVEQETSQHQLMYDAYVTQNQELMNENQLTKQKMEKINQRLEELKQELEPLKLTNIRLENELKAEQEEKAFLLTHQEELATRSILSPNETDTKELDQLKAANEQAQLDIAAKDAEIVSLKESVKSLNEKIKALEEELEATKAHQATIVASGSQKQRIAIELKNRLNEANRKIADYEAEMSKLKENNSTKATTPDAQKIKSLEEALKKEQEGKHTIEQNLKTAEASLKTVETSLKKKTDEFASLENKYTGILNRAKVIQSERNKMSEEVKALKAELESLQKSKEESNQQADAVEVAAFQEEIAKRQGEIERLELALQESEIEKGRLLVMNSMSQNKYKRLQEEIDRINGSAPSDVESSQGVKRERDENNDLPVSPKKK